MATILPSPFLSCKAAIFDIFGTVVNWEASVTRQLQAKSPNSQLDLLKFTKDWRAGYMRETKAIAAGKPGTNNVDVLHRELLDELLLMDEWKVLAAWNEVDRNEATAFWHKLDGWPGSSEGINGVRALKGDGDGILVATLSNGSTRLLMDLARHANLNFDAIFAADLLKAFKPSREMYLGACGFLNIAPEEVVMVASHLYDLKGAASYGLKTCYVVRATEDQNLPGVPGGPEAVRTKADGGEVDYIIRSLDELPALFAQ